jgi:phosphoglycolate phosphatase
MTKLPRTQKVIIFDFDGVLADSLQMMLSYSAQVCLELGYPCQPSPADLEALDPMSFDSLGRQLNLPEAVVPAYKKRVFERFTSGDELPPIFEGMAEVVSALASSYPLGLVTGNTSGLVRSFLERYNLLDWFGLILCVDDPGTRVEKIRRVIKELGDQNAEVYLVGDAVSDIYAAREAGVKSIAVTWGHQSREKLVTARPDFLVDSPGGLLSVLEGGI